MTSHPSIARRPAPARRPPSQRGATLIEFLVGFTLLGILVGLAVPSFKEWIQNGQVRTAAEAVNNGLNYARAEAVKRNSPVRMRLPDTSSTGWVVEEFNRTSAAWTQIQARSSQEGTANVTMTATLGSVIFLGNGSVTPTPTSDITFDLKHRTGGACLSTDGTGDVRCLRVTVSPGGQIRLCDPALPAGNVASC